MGDDGDEREEREENQAMKYRTTALLANPSVSWERISSSRLTISVWKDTEVKIISNSQVYIVLQTSENSNLQFLVLSLSLKAVYTYCYLLLVLLLIYREDCK